MKPHVMVREANHLAESPVLGSERLTRDAGGQRARAHPSTNGTTNTRMVRCAALFPKAYHGFSR
jgi:hypothetical protein